MFFCICNNLSSNKKTKIADFIPKMCQVDFNNLICFGVFKVNLFFLHLKEVNCIKGYSYMTNIAHCYHLQILNICINIPSGHVQFQYFSFDFNGLHLENVTNFKTLSHVDDHVTRLCTSKHMYDDWLSFKGETLTFKIPWVRV